MDNSIFLFKRVADKLKMWKRRIYLKIIFLRKERGL
jgi:hypothetical protein